MNTVSLADLFATFFRIGLFTLGGGLAMSPVMRHELVFKRRWLQDGQFLSLLSLATVVPGAIAVNMAYLLGHRLRGKKGALAAVLGTILPSFFVILLVAGMLVPFFSLPGAVSFFRGCSLAVAGQLAFAGYVFGRKLLRRWQHFALCAAGLITVGIFRVHPLGGLAAAALLGYWLIPGSELESESKESL